MSDLVFNIRSATASKVRAMDRHERWREVDGVSAIDKDRTHLNQTLHYVGQERDRAAVDGVSSPPAPPGPLEALERFYEGGVKRPSKQAEAPYLQIVISASSSYFRPDDPEAVGTWDEARMEAWRDRVLAWLKAQFGDDLVHVSLHLDEDTPHIHVLVAPTYLRKARKPGRKKRNETDAEFEVRKEAAQNSEGIRTVGRSSHDLLSKRGSYTILRQSLAMVLDDFGIGYGNDRGPGAPKGTSTREWVRRQVAKLREKEAEIAKEQTEMAREKEEIAIERNNLEHKKEKITRYKVEIKKIYEAEKEKICLREDAVIRRETYVSEREIKVSKMEEGILDIYARMKRLLGDVADRLSVGKSFREVGLAIVEYKKLIQPATGLVDRLLQEKNERKRVHQDPNPTDARNDSGPSL